MTKTKPFSELVAKATAEPARRACFEIYRRAIADSLALAELRAEWGVTQ